MSKLTKKEVPAKVSQRPQHRSRWRVLALASLWITAVDAAQVCEPQLPASAPATRFEIGADSAYDTATGLTWRRCFEGLSGENCATGELLELSWPKALQHVTTVNAEANTTWRLPNVKELYSLVEQRCAAPAIDLSVFPNTPAGRVWTASPYRLYPHYSWLVDFADGSTFNLERFKPFPVLLVRDGR